MTCKKITVLFIFLIALNSAKAYGQEVSHNISNTGVYEFLDELADTRIIEINSVIKPYSRLYVAGKLKEASTRRDKLTKRQQKELDFYLRDFGKESGYDGLKKRTDLFYYKDSLFSLTVNPIAGGEVFQNDKGRATYWRNGIEARAYAGNWGFSASLRDNHENPLLGRNEFLTSREGGHIKGSTDWSDMQGGVTYSWKWGNAGLVKEKTMWGNNYNGANILSGISPSFIHLRLQLKPTRWFTFNYIHGWLNSMVVDSTDSYMVHNSYGDDYREVYHKKYLAANMFTFTPLPGLNLSAGNSIIYTDENINPAYLIPLFFYKSVDHSLTSGIDNMNSQMFLDISSRQIKHLHLYTTLFIDELSVRRFTKKDEWNFLSWKAGFRLADIPVPNLSITTELTYTYPLTFQHYVPTLTFETAGFNLGHYLKDNSRELFFSLNYKPFRTLNMSIFLIDAVRGPDYTALGGSRLGNPPLDEIKWSNRTAGFKAGYQVINDLYVWVSYFTSNIKGEPSWSPVFFHGNNNTLNAGITAGF